MVNIDESPLYPKHLAGLTEIQMHQKYLSELLEHCPSNHGLVTKAMVALDKAAADHNSIVARL